MAVNNKSVTRAKVEKAKDALEAVLDRTGIDTIWEPGERAELETASDILSRLRERAAYREH